ncbi:MAG: 50S ribosomal protein L13 [bacterium]
MNKIERKTHHIDAAGKVSGRLATEIVCLLRGKNKADYQPHIDNGDFVEVTNCDKMKFTGKKMEQKEYHWHTQHPGGIKSKLMKDVFAKDPSEVLKKAVWGMMAKNKLRARMILRLIIK